MYIPITFFGSQGSCFTTTTSTISGSGTITTGSFVSGGFVWDYYQFQTTDYTDPTYTAFTASLNILTGSTNQAKLLIVGGGGAGGSGGSPSSDFSAGGGGGGGVVYYNNFPITSGSYEIGVGGATTQISSLAIGNNGRNSYIKLPNNLTYTPFTSSFLTAFGGGGGGYGQVDGTIPITCLSNNGGAGPTTGGIGTISNAPCGGGSATSTIYTTLNGITLAPQGFKGGDVADSTPDFSVVAATGGGGAATTGSNLSKNDMASGTYASNGGAGLQFNMNGTPTYFSPGGGGQASGQTGAKGLGGDTYGRGGQGERDGNTTSVNFGFGGVVIIAIPKCEALFSCREFAITGSGGVATFLQCGSPTTTSTTLANGFDIVSCLKIYSGSNTPVLATGATYVALSASCDTAFTSSNNGCIDCNTYAVTSDTNKIARVTYTPCNQSSSFTTYVAGTYNLCVSGSSISVATGSASSLGTVCSVIGCDISPSNDNTPTCPCQALFVNVFSGRYDFDYTDCNGVTQRRSSSSSPFCGVPGSIRNGSCGFGSCLGLTIRQTGTCCTFP
jgi:hypothetical protein